MISFVQFYFLQFLLFS